MSTTLAPLSPLPPYTAPIVRSGPDGVIYYIPTSPSACKTTILLPQNSTWTSGLHFHAQHTEYLRLVRGCISVQLGARKMLLSASLGGEMGPDGAGNGGGKLETPGLVVKVDKCVRHEWCRADSFSPSSLHEHGIGREDLPLDWTDDVVVEEWTDPSDISKPLFFWNLNGVILAEGEADAAAKKGVIGRMMGSYWVVLQLFLIFWELDNWPVFFSMEGRVGRGVEYVVSFLVLFLARVAGSVIGVKAVTEERTPKELWTTYSKNGSMHIKDD